MLQAAPADERVNSDTRFLADHHIESVCAIPVQMRNKRKGALVLLRQEASEFNQVWLSQAADLTPALQDAIQRADQFQLIDEVKAALQKAEAGSAEAESVCQTVCELVGAHYDCLETSIFLQKTPDAGGRFDNVGATFPRFLRKSSYVEDEPGLTGYVIANRRSVAILNLCSFKMDQDYIGLCYPGLKWDLWLDLRSEIRKELALEDSQPDPPVSFMAAPIVAGQKTLGVIRCCALRQLPFYFSEDDVSVLEVVASQLGQVWQKHLDQILLQQEIRVWRRHSEAVERLNRMVQRELRRPEVKEKAILDGCLKEIAQVVPSADILDIRLIDENTGRLWFAATYGEPWLGGAEDEVNARLATTYSVTANPPDSAAGWVYQNQEVRLIKNADADPYCRKLFRDLRGLIVAPVTLRDDKYGVLGISTTSSVPFPDYFGTIAGLMGQQLGLYIHLARTIGELKKTKAQLDRTVRVQNESYENLRHQINSPLNLAYARCHAIIAAQGLPTQLNAHALAIRGLLGKARQVGRALSIFVRLAEGKRLDPRLVPLAPGFAFKAVLEACEDNRRLYEKRGLRFEIDRNSIDRLDAIKVSADLDLFEQAVNNVIDNAFKYSYPGSVIDVRAASEGNYFIFAVSNQGLEVRSEDIPRLKRRGERGDQARLASAQGAGLGWWLVDNILRAHEGSFEVQATNAEGRTQVSLRFPIDRSGRV